jgi:hypothetical protein
MQLMNVKVSKKFNMTSYIVYLLAGKNKYRGLNCKGTLGKNIIFYVYPQLKFNTN